MKLTIYIPDEHAAYAFSLMRGFFERKAADMTAAAQFFSEVGEYASPDKVSEAVGKEALWRSLAAQFEAHQQ